MEDLSKNHPVTVTYLVATLTDCSYTTLLDSTSRPQRRGEPRLLIYWMTHEPRFVYGRLVTRCSGMSRGRAMFSLT